MQCRLRRGHIELASGNCAAIVDTMGTGTKWDSKSSLFACKATVAASENAITGAGQKKSKYEDSIYAKFLEYVSIAETAGDKNAAKYRDRKAGAVRQRYVKVRLECIKFESARKMVIAAKPTGSPTDEDIWNAALAIYNGTGGVSDM